MSLFKKLKKAMGGASENQPSQPTQPIKPSSAPEQNSFSFTITVTAEDLARAEDPVHQTAVKAEEEKRLSHLDENGEIPSGWYYKYHDLIKTWEAPIPDYATSSRQIDLPIDERIEILEKMMSHLHAFQDDFNARGKCFQKYFYDIWVANGYFKQWEEELADLEKNRDTIFAQQEVYRQERPGLEDRLFQLLKENDGILQKNTYKKFHPCVKKDIQSLLYEWEKSGKIQRAKQGNTYAIHVM